MNSRNHQQKIEKGGAAGEEMVGTPTPPPPLTALAHSPPPVPRSWHAFCGVPTSPLRVRLGMIRQDESGRQFMVQPVTQLKQDPKVKARTKVWR